MTPKEKALELIDKVSEFSDYETMNDLIPQKELVLIIVNEILKLDLSKPYQEENYLAHYWSEVKKEINLL